MRPAATSSTARTTSASGASLSTNPRAPASSASVSSARSPNAVYRITAVSGTVRATCRATSMPDMPGMRRSRIATCGLRSSICSTASLPSRARPAISIPCSSSTSATASTTAGWSSATRQVVTVRPLPEAHGAGHRIAEFGVVEWSGVWHHSCLGPDADPRGDHRARGDTTPRRRVPSGRSGC